MKLGTAIFAVGALPSLIQALPTSSSSSSHTGDVLNQIWTRASSAVTSDLNAVKDKTFSHIVIGCGLAGSVVSARLSEDSQNSVLCVEAGSDTRSADNVVHAYSYGDVTSDEEKNFKYPPTANGRELSVSAGKGLGGSTSINGLAVTRPPQSQIDAFGQDIGTGWSWEMLLPYMKKAEKFDPPSDDLKALGADWDPSAHGTDGPVAVGYPSTLYRGEIINRYSEAITNTVGTPHIQDSNNGVQPGVCRTPNTILPGSGDAQTRVSAATAYITPNEARKNLIFLTGTRGERINWDDGSGDAKAQSVRLRQDEDGEFVDVPVSGAVVAASGAIASPVFLQLSGIGSSGLLDDLGITQKVPLDGVGKHLTEQTMSSLGADGGGDPDGNGPSGLIAYMSVDNLFSNSSDVREYVEDNLDAYAQSAVDAGAAVSKNAMLKQFKSHVAGIFDKQEGLVELFADNGYPSDRGGLVWNLLPFSRGSVSASANSAFGNPRVDPRYFSASWDLDVQIEAARAVRRIFQALGVDETVPGFDAGNGGVPDGPQNGDYQGWKEWVLNKFSSVAHPMSTCMMAPREDGGVVDNDFKVYGTSNVFVADASVVPMAISAHLQSFLYGVAELAADKIKDSA
ncbi:alcohol oxidase [Ceraceosorus guamensis]|uniref:Alcohol oxidase n=1 Tax=Ceraceosorus guamensis TaxID=1522189 RepID=A0A316W0S7_9BASI|nr:alcohol oxidase [Ceraceosorus guamensis]PWN43527.1 alcohol oxidase [Ceraceosorus guamensis]